MSRYDLLAAAYVTRDRYAVIIFGFAALVLITDWATRKTPWLNKAWRAFLVIAWLGLIVYGWLE